jgi:site-specific recombinase XerD
MGIFYDRMAEDLKLRGYQPRTQEAYLGYAKKFVATYMRPPTELGEEEVRRFLLQVIDETHSTSQQKMYTAAIKFLYVHTLRRPEIVDHVPWPRVNSRIPDILSEDEVERVLASLPQAKHRLVLMTAYGTGARISEACRLRTDDIDRDRGVIHIREGKGGKDRVVMLPVRLYLALRAYFAAERPPVPLLFPGRKPGQPLTRDAVATALKRAMQRAGIKKRITPHSLRHAFASHLLESGTDIRVIQLLLGHRSIRTTCRYTQVSRAHIASVTSPLDRSERTTRTHHSA